MTEREEKLLNLIIHRWRGPRGGFHAWLPLPSVGYPSGEYLTMVSREGNPAYWFPDRESARAAVEMAIGEKEGS